MIFNRIFHASSSENYEILSRPNLDKLRKLYSDAWKDSSIPAKQLGTTYKQSQNFLNVPAIADLIALIKRTKTKNPTVLEIGCSTGYHVEALRQAKLKVQYSGCDYSSFFIDQAKKLHPGIDFKIADAIDLPYPAKQSDIVISGCCLLHIVDYQKAIKECSRVAKKYVIFHRTPILHLSPTRFTLKTGYGVRMLEIHFNEDELVNLINKNNLSVINIKTHTKFSVKGSSDDVYMKDYLCIKKQ